MAVRDDFAAGEVLAAADLNDTFASKLDLAGGKILQIVRATDSTNRSTTSTSYVDANLSVTITPQKSDSAILLIATYNAQSPSTAAALNTQITDSSNNAISGAEESRLINSSSSLYVAAPAVIVGYSTPATTSATTYKLRFKVTASTGTLGNATQTAQLLAIEVSA